MRFFPRFAAAVILAAMFIFTGILSGCSNGGSDPYANITPELRLAPVLADGTAPYHIGITDDGIQRYEIPVGQTVTVNLVWTPMTPAGELEYEITHYVNSFAQQSETRGGPSEIDGSLSITMNDFGYHLIQVKAKIGEKTMGFGQVILEVPKG